MNTLHACRRMPRSCGPSFAMKRWLLAVTLTMVLCGMTLRDAKAAPLNLPDVPLFVLNTVDPNIIFTLDDSGSMAWSFLPDDVYYYDTNRAGCSSAFNKVYYDPTTTYPAAVDASGVTLGDASFTNAWVSGYDQGGARVNLATSYQATWYYGSYADCGTGTTAGQPAFYYNYDPVGTACAPASNTNDNCYVRVTVGATSGPGGSDERQNFANWYSYYRTRILMAKTAVGRAFARLGTNARVAYQRINSCNGGLGTAPTPDVAGGTCTGTYMKSFSGIDRSDFFSWLYRSPANGGTPLVQAFVRAGNYLGTSSIYNPWAKTPGSVVRPEYSCRQTFHIAMTDGYWNGGSAGGNVDGRSYTLPDGRTYNPAGLPANRQIYPDSNVGYLADNTFLFWSRDARTDIPNNVPQHWVDTTGTTDENYYNPKNDPANWQHMVTFTIGLGIDGTLNHPADYNNLLNGTRNWNAGDHIDDLWHAAVNGRGDYFSAKNPTILATSLTSILNQIGARTGTAAGLTANGGSVSGNTRIYQVTFNTSSWSGQLLARAIDPTTGLPATTIDWDAAVVLNSQNYDTGRTVLTLNPDPLVNQGVAFRWANLSAAQQAALNANPDTGAVDGNGAQRLDYLRGASANENSNPGSLGFRVRTCYDANGNALAACPADVGKLGDIVHSSATFVGKPPFHYPDTLEGVANRYSTFATTYASRTPMLYAGANDGMLHGFDATTGRERMAYVPNLVFSNLNQLTSPNYAHKYFVDATPTVGDVFINGAWKTVLIGGLGKGGKGYYALDITDPSAFSESGTRPRTTVLWEFTDPDLGYSFSEPSIVKMANGRWAAIFGNGYNNTGTGHSSVYVVFIEAGTDGAWGPADFVKLDTSVVTSATNPGTAADPNGMSTPAAVDINHDNVIDYIYAGDLRGRLWRFDVRDPNAANWTGRANINLLFSAVDANGVAQPITTKPSVGQHPLRLGGEVVFFGTGKYLEFSDNTVTAPAQTQTFYVVWDRGVTAFPGEPSYAFNVARADLLQQTISATTTSGGYEVRVVSDNPISWRMTAATNPSAPPAYLGWYVDLPTSGERQVTGSLLRDDRVIFTTLIPSTDPCQVGGTGWLMELNSNNGGRLLETFDLNGDLAFTSADYVSSGTARVPAAGVRQIGGSGAPQRPSPLSNQPGLSGACRETILALDSNNRIMKIAVACASYNIRQSWREWRQ